MRSLLVILSLTLIIVSCKNDSVPGTTDELQKLKAELEAKKKILADKEEIAAIEQQLNAVEKQIKTLDQTGKTSAPQPDESLMSGSGEVPRIKTHINATNVTMRKEASVQSEKIGTFDLKEPVLILETKNVNNENEAILTKSIPLYVNENNTGEVAMTLPKGKAVVIENYDAEKNKYEVSYQMPQKGKLYAHINADAVETITYSTWYKVKRGNGEIGWVLGKFVNQN